MDYIRQIQQFKACGEQEITDQKSILSYVLQEGSRALLRESALAHITASGFVMNKQLDKVLLVHHNIRGTWSWTGGHADGHGHLLQVACREAKEETGASEVQPLFEEIVALDILPVFAHWRRGVYVSAHLHLSVAYILLCDEREKLRPQLSENSAVAWFPLSYFTDEHFSPHDTRLYNKLIERALRR